MCDSWWHLTIVSLKSHRSWASVTRNLAIANSALFNNPIKHDSENNTCSPILRHSLAYIDRFSKFFHCWTTTKFAARLVLYVPVPTIP